MGREREGGWHCVAAAAAASLNTHSHHNSKTPSYHVAMVTQDVDADERLSAKRRYAWRCLERR